MPNQEVSAIQAITLSLDPLDHAARMRVLDYVVEAERAAAPRSYAETYARSLAGKVFNRGGEMT